MSIKPTGFNGGLIGHVFDPDKTDSMPSFTDGWSPERRKQWAERKTAEMAVVSECSICGEPQTADSEQTHAIDHSDDDIRSVLRSYAQMSDDQRARFQQAVKRVF